MKERYLKFNKIELVVYNVKINKKMKKKRSYLKKERLFVD